MTDREILNRIDAEIERTLKMIWHISNNSDIANSMEDGCDSYINGLKFSRELIEKRMEGETF
jgi:hypothetical protein